MTLTSSLLCLTTVLYMEARGDGNTHAARQDAMIAVADVVLTRASINGETICETVQKPRQFAYLDPMKLDYEPASWRDAMDAANAALDGERLHLGATHFHSGPKPYWTKGAVYVGRIGSHMFWRVE